MHIQPATLTKTNISAAPIALSKTRRVSAAVLLGAALIFLTGFAELPIFHNAAHDARHSAAFPCH